MSLNEKLAEVCGLEKTPIKAPFTMSGIDHCYTYPNGRTMAIPSWNPIENLNQLRECYLAAEKDCKLSFPNISFAHKFKDAVDELFTDMTEYPAVPSELATMWIVYPELVAQAILKAKGVEL